ncbi:hypothetical protein TNCV_2410761 [Trichonephila clavipes]|nr:hypothetical protein TNCV_2410761 [Trichonephila clavipes]
MGHVSKFLRCPFLDVKSPVSENISIHVGVPITWGPHIIDTADTVVDHCCWTSGGRSVGGASTSRKVYREESEWKSQSSYWLMKSEDNGSVNMAAHVGGVSGVVTDVQ